MQSFLILSDVKLLHLGCRSSTCRLRCVPALLVSYNSFGPKNTVWCKSNYIKMPKIVLKLKGKKFCLSYAVHARTDCLLFCPPCLFQLPFPSNLTYLKLGVILHALCVTCQQMNWDKLMFLLRKFDGEPQIHLPAKLSNILSANAHRSQPFPHLSRRIHYNICH